MKTHQLPPDDADEFDDVVGTKTQETELITKVIAEIRKQEADAKKDTYFIIYPPYVPLCMFRYAYATQ